MNVQGGQYLDKAGSRVRRWTWPNSLTSSGPCVLLRPIFISLNQHVGVRIVGQDKITVSFLAMGQQAKFNMGTRVQVFLKCAGSSTHSCSPQQEWGSRGSSCPQITPHGGCPLPCPAAPGSPSSAGLSPGERPHPKPHSSVPARGHGSTDTAHLHSCQVSPASRPCPPTLLSEDDLLLLALRVRILRLFDKLRGCLSFPSNEQWEKIKPPAYLMTQTLKILHLCTTSDLSEELRSSVRAIVNAQV